MSSNLAAPAPGAATARPVREPFGRRFADALAARGPFCVGIDPHAALLEAWGLRDDIAGLERFALTAVEAVAGECAMVKPQSAFYERFGSRGIAVLERVVAVARQAGALVLMDAKRGDIGSTSQAYAEAYLDPGSPLCCDAVTASPYLGFGSLDPFVETARTRGAGVFVLVETSNPEAAEVQRAEVEPGVTVAQRVTDRLRRLNGTTEPLGSFGAVVGATVRHSRTDFDVGGPILAPGFGAQGGTAADISGIFGPLRDRVAPSSSREVLGTGPDPRAMRDVVRRTNDELVRVLRS